MRGSVPEIIFGKDPTCGSGGDYPASELTGADSQSNIDTSGYGEHLLWFEGVLMGNSCKKNRIQREESYLKTERHSHAQAFRDSMGFTKTIR